YAKSDPVQQRRAGRAGTGLDRRAGPSHADGRLQRDREGPLSSFQYLWWRANALHAAHHLVGGSAARRRAARTSGLARLHSNGPRLGEEAVAHYQAWGARDGGAG